MKGLLVICLVALAVDGQEEEGNTVGAIPGQAGRDYPNFQEIPESSFSCQDLSPGFYADPEGECQVYHRCTPNSILSVTGGSMWIAARSPTTTDSTTTIWL